MIGQRLPGLRCGPMGLVYGLYGHASHWWKLLFAIFRHCETIGIIKVGVMGRRDAGNQFSCCGLETADGNGICTDLRGKTFFNTILWLDFPHFLKRLAPLPLYRTFCVSARQFLKNNNKIAKLNYELLDV